MPFSEALVPSERLRCPRWAGPEGAGQAGDLQSPLWLETQAFGGALPWLHRQAQASGQVCVYKQGACECARGGLGLCFTPAWHAASLGKDPRGWRASL